MSARSILVKQLKCLACEIEDVDQPAITHEHHLNLGGKAGQKRLGDEYSVALCAWHHVGEPPNGMTASEATFHYGPSLARSSRRFRECYGEDVKLLMITNEKLQAL